MESFYHIQTVLQRSLYLHFMNPFGRSQKLYAGQFLPEIHVTIPDENKNEAKQQQKQYKKTNKTNKKRNEMKTTTKTNKKKQPNTYLFYS